MTVRIIIDIIEDGKADVIVGAPKIERAEPQAEIPAPESMKDKVARKKREKNAETQAATPAPAEQPAAAQPQGQSAPEVSAPVVEVIAPEKLKEAMKAYLQRKGNDEKAVAGALEAMQRYGATMLSEVLPEHRAALLKDLEA